MKDAATWTICNTAVMPFGAEQHLLDSAERACRQSIDHMARTMGIRASCPSRVIGKPEWVSSCWEGMLEYNLEVQYQLEVYVHAFMAPLNANGCSVSPPDFDSDTDDDRG